MSTPGALLGYLQVFVIEDNIIRAGIYTQLTTATSLRIDNNQPIIIHLYSTRGTSFYTWSIVTMLARYKYIGYPDMRLLPLFKIMYLSPELICIRLWLSIWSPIVSTVLIFTSYLAAITASAFIAIHNKRFHIISPPHQ
jgi:hypothetical protein